MARYRFESLKPEYDRLWSTMRVRPDAYSGRYGAKYWAELIIKNRTIYEKVQARTNVPWFVVGCMHYRESSCRFNTWLHNGDPMRDKNNRPVRTIRVPANRPPNPNVDWVEGAYDALVVVKGFDKITDWSPARVAYILESFNGWGYRNPTINIPSPYLWGGTTIQKRGKYVADHVYDPKAWDTQLGGMAVLRAIMDLCPDARFDYPAVQSEPLDIEKPDAPVISPKADDVGSAGMRPISRSRIVWGTITTFIGGVVTNGLSLFGFVNNPYAFAAFVLLFLAMALAVVLVIRGYVDVSKLVHHLSEEG